MGGGRGKEEVGWGGGGWEGGGREGMGEERRLDEEGNELSRILPCS